MFTESQLKEYAAMWDKRWMRVDPETKKPHQSNKTCFWQITGQYPSVRFGENMNEPKMTFQVTRFCRDKTYEASVSPDGHGSTTRHVAFHDVDRRGQLIAPGCVNIEYADFLKQFVEDGKEAGR